MAIQDAFIAELKHESSLTRKMLERVPLEKKDWKPHEKSMTLGRLAGHVADCIAWASAIRQIDDFNFASDYNFSAGSPADTETLLRKFDEYLGKAIEDLSAMSDADYDSIWTVRAGEQVMFQLPKKVAVRGWAFSHLIHHRGQLSVYLRLLDVPVPGMYGPSADER